MHTDGGADSMFKAIEARLEECGKHGGEAWFPDEGWSLQHGARPTMTGAGPEQHVGVRPGATSPPPNLSWKLPHTCALICTKLQTTYLVSPILKGVSDSRSPAERWRAPLTRT